MAKRKSSKKDPDAQKAVNPEPTAMSSDGEGQPPQTPVIPGNDGLPLVSPDIVEQELGAEFDNIIPTRGYEMIPMVALGGSAGGVKALQDFFAAMPPDSGFIFVVILHLSSEYESILADVLQRSTSMKVVQVTRTIKVEPNWVYVIPPGKIMMTIDGHLTLINKVPEHGRRTAVDQFFRTMADTYGPHSAGIVISGSDGDGTIGIKRIKERGGLTIAQDPDEAEHGGMPRSAISTGMIDWVLRISEIPARLQAYLVQEMRLRVLPEEGPQPASVVQPAINDAEVVLRDVLACLRTRTERDFSYYKRATILRRISRRLLVNGIDDLPSYLTYLRTHPGEAGALLKDLLISVTNFFRDREAFHALEGQMTKLFQGKGPNDTIRVWVPGCATGEEAYSVAMIVSEHARKLETPPVIQIFATDLDGEVIRDAREGVYPETIAEDVSEERLRRFFLKEHRGYRVRREIRETVLFAIHDLLKDSPFSRLDLVSCRNLLIYLNRDAQSRAFEIFHFALNPPGVLFLGSSESVEDDSKLFSVIDKKYRVYTRRNTLRSGFPMPSGPSAMLLAQNQMNLAVAPVISRRAMDSSGMLGALRTEPKGESGSWAEAHFRLIERFGPPSLIVSADYEILHLSENAGRYLQMSGGEPSRNILHLVHPMLRIELRAALYSSAQSHEPTQVSGPALIDGRRLRVTIHVVPADDIVAGGMLVMFDMHPAEAMESESEYRVESEPAARHLERELERVKSHLRDTIEQYEASTEELKAGNEELQAMNEELRSATEELETGREELQSINEELTTVNQELKSKVDELGTANSDLHNLMASTAIATVFLDRELCITRYTPRAIEIFSLIPTDIGRPLNDLTHKLLYPDLLRDASSVLETLVPIERKVGELGGRWFLGRILPYRTIEDRIAGVVLTFVDITEQYMAEHAALEIEAEFRSIFDVTAVGMAQADPETGTIIRGNKKLCSILNCLPEDLITMNISDLIDAGEGEINQELMHRLHRGEIPEFSVEKHLERRDGQIVWIECTVALQRTSEGPAKRIVFAVVDVTLRNDAEIALRQREEQLRESNLVLDERVKDRTRELLESETKLREIAEMSDQRADQLQFLTNELITAEQSERRRIAHVLHDHIQQLLVAAKFQAENIKDVNAVKSPSEVADNLINIMNHAIDATRTLSVELVPPLLHDEGLPAALEWLTERVGHQHQLKVVVETNSYTDKLPSEMRDLAFQSVRELLLNVVKHAKVKLATVRLSNFDGWTVVEIIDNGVGFMAGDEQRRSKTFGLSQIRERIEAVGGTFSIQSSPGHGARVSIRLPNKQNRSLR